MGTVWDELLGRQRSAAVRETQRAQANNNDNIRSVEVAFYRE